MVNANDTTLLEEQRENVSRMLEEMHRTLNAIGDYSDDEEEYTDESDDEKDPLATAASTKDGTAAEPGPEVTPPKKKKKKRSKNSRKLDLESLLDKDAPPDPNDIDPFDPTTSAAARVELAVTRFRKNRKLDEVRSKILSVYLDYGGIRSGPKSFQGGGISTGGINDDGEPDFEAMNAGIDLVEDPSDDQVVDFTNVVTTFLSEHFIKHTGWVTAQYYKDAPIVVASLLSYFLLRNVLPEYEDDLRQALAVAEKAKIELPLCKKLSGRIPGRFDRACSVVFGGAQKGLDSWADEQVIADPLRMDESTAKGIIQSALGPDADLSSIRAVKSELVMLTVVEVKMPESYKPLITDENSPPESQEEAEKRVDAMLSRVIDATLTKADNTQGANVTIVDKVAENQLQEEAWPMPVFASVILEDSNPPPCSQYGQEAPRRYKGNFEADAAAILLAGMRVRAKAFTLSNGISYLEQCTIFPTFYLEADVVEEDDDEMHL